MLKSFYLAMRHVTYYRWKTLVMVGCITMTLFLPILLAILLQEFDRRISARAERTPLVIGGKGSGVDLTLHALYFSASPLEPITYGDDAAARNTGLVQTIPIHCRFNARGFPVVGTTIDYFDFRELKLASGRKFATLGECVLGNAVARNLNLREGDNLLTDRENLVDIAGLYPLRLHVVGVLEKSKTADDNAVFVDLKSSWVMQGLGHGHEDLSQEKDEGKILARANNNIVASAAVLPYLEITEANAASVHFHGDQNTFPLTAIIATARDRKDETIFIGRFQNPKANTTTQILVPSVVIADLMGLVFKVSQLFNASITLVSLSTFCLLGLVVALSLRLRAGEMQTMFRIGCSRMTIFKLQAAELSIVFCLAAALVACLVFLSISFGGRILENLIVG